MSLWKDRKKFLLEQLKPRLSEIGFEAIGTTASGFRTTATHIEFERRQETTFDNLTIVFDKYWRPKFQITFRRRELHSPHRITKSAHLSKRKGELTAWWGIHWYSLNKEKAWKRSIERVGDRMDQVDVFLNTGVSGKNITNMSKYF